jgi:hypothetical protein
MNDQTGEYLNGHSNGNGHYNGNGYREKAFVLGQPKTPEQVHRESILATMPELRRNCSRDPRLKGRDGVGAKWLFGTLTDLSFLHNYGGNGFGIVILSVKDLSRIFRHHKDSISRWRDLLITHSWIWFVDLWPKSQWGICGVTKQPELLPDHSDYLRVAAKAARPTEQAHPPQDGKTLFFGRNGGGKSPTEPTEQADRAYGVGRPSLRSRPNEPTQPASIGPLSRPDSPTEQDSPACSVGSDGLLNRPSPADGTGCIQETPIGVRSQEAIKGVLSPKFEAWKKRLEGEFPRSLRQLKAEFLEQKKKADPSEIADLNARIEAVEEALYGGAVPKSKTKTALPVKPKSAGKILSPGDIEKQGKALAAAMREAVENAPPSTKARPVKAAVIKS